VSFATSSVAEPLVVNDGRRIGVAVGNLKELDVLADEPSVVRLVRKR
jgi:hypothetical protein